ncbi:MAG: acyl-[acyl-carrier-protein]--UDP-N-acetylglucosamine O-acyltransferase [Rickettsiales bacterium]|nr:acyl-[acyl-carrier-protein]--UDP-N-acetylglucosamine O-acyltransferase [Rickettsiales bacterium]
MGNPPQDLKFGGEKSELIIGDYNIIREHVTMNPGTSGGGLVTKVGNNCLIMIGAHVAHDCIIGNNVILANNASLAGHVVVNDYAILGGLSGVHQFCRIGSHAMVGGLSAVESDVIPYGSVIGNRAYLSGLNIVGLKRRGFTREVIHDLRKAYRLLFAPEGTIQERLKDVSDEFKNNEPVMDIVKFIEESENRAICQPKNGNKNS